VEKRARQLLASGYAKLTSFECIDPSETARREGTNGLARPPPPTRP